MYKKRGEPKQYKGFFAKHRLSIATATLVGTVVGAGILAIPYVVSQSGFLIGFIIMVLLGLALLFLNLLVGEVVLRTKEQHQLIGYTEKYLGTWGKRVMTFSLLFSIYGALTAYLIGEGEVLKAIFHWGHPLLYSLIFLVITAGIIYKGIKATGKAELVLIIVLFVVVILVGIFSYDDINSNYLNTIDLAKFFIPYGVILFAFVGYQAIPEMQEELEREKRKMKKAIIIGSVIPIVLYVLFAFFIIGIIGLENFELLAPNERIATVALSIFSSPLLGTLANIIAVLAMFTSFLTIGIALAEVYEYDYLLSRSKALLLTFSVPVVITAFGLSTFIGVIAITGAVAGGIEGILIILMYGKAKLLGDRRPEYSLRHYKLVGIILMVVFALGIIYQIWANFF